MSEISDRVFELAREVFSLESEYLLEETFGPEDVPGWDSLGTLRLVSAAERAFGVEFGLEDIADLTSLGHLRKVIEERLRTD
jgi:acyl carrier protein